MSFRVHTSLTPGFVKYQQQIRRNQTSGQELEHPPGCGHAFDRNLNTSNNCHCYMVQNPAWITTKPSPPCTPSKPQTQRPAWGCCECDKGQPDMLQECGQSIIDCDRAACQQQQPWIQRPTTAGCQEGHLENGVPFPTKVMIPVAQ